MFQRGVKHIVKHIDLPHIVKHIDLPGDLYVSVYAGDLYVTLYVSPPSETDTETYRSPGINVQMGALGQLQHQYMRMLSKRCRSKKKNFFR